MVTGVTCGHVPRHDGIVRSNVSAKQDTFNIGTRVKYACPAGYNLRGDSGAYCREDGEY